MKDPEEFYIVLPNDNREGHPFATSGDVFLVGDDKWEYCGLRQKDSWHLLELFEENNAVKISIKDLVACWRKHNPPPCTAMVVYTGHLSSK